MSDSDTTNGVSCSDYMSTLCTSGCCGSSSTDVIDPNQPTEIGSHASKTAPKLPTDLASQIRGVSATTNPDVTKAPPIDQSSEVELPSSTTEAVKEMKTNTLTDTVTTELNKVDKDKIAKGIYDQAETLAQSQAKKAVTQMKSGVMEAVAKVPSPKLEGK